MTGAQLLLNIILQDWFSLSFMPLDRAGESKLLSSEFIRTEQL